MKESKREIDEEFGVKMSEKFNEKNNIGRKREDVW